MRASEAVRDDSDVFVMAVIDERIGSLPEMASPHKLGGEDPKQYMCSKHKADNPGHGGLEGGG